MLIGVQINHRDTQGRNALYWAIKKHSICNVKMLIEHEISLEVAHKLHALFHAIEEDHYESVVYLIQSGLSPNITDARGRTPLMVAIEKEQFRTVCFLIRNGADLYMMDSNYDMASEYANRCECNMIKDFIKHVDLINQETEGSISSTCHTCTDYSCKI
jgi:ankyrin repeat protein